MMEWDRLIIWLRKIYFCDQRRNLDFLCDAPWSEINKTSYCKLRHCVFLLGRSRHRCFCVISKIASKTPITS